MSIPPNIQDAIYRLDNELDEIEQQATEGMNLVRSILSIFPDNAILLQFFVSLSNTLLFAEIARRRIQITINRLKSVNVTAEDIQEVGEDLGTELGRALEAKIRVRQILVRLQKLS